MSSFKEFLTTGKIAGVVIGMHPQAAEELLGPPDDRSVKRHPAEIWRFGSLELTFKNIPDSSDSRLVAAAFYFNRPGQQLPIAAQFDDWTPTAATTESEFREFLASIGLQVHSHADGDYVQLVADTGASATFDEGKLRSVRFRRADKTTHRRQTSVSLPEGTLSQLRMRARQENISLQELIERTLSKIA